MKILWGECRYTAVSYLQAAFADENLPDLPPEQIADLRRWATATPLYENWTKIPARLVKGSDNYEHSILEFIENIHREELPWQDKATAALSIHDRFVEIAKAKGERWLDKQTSEMIGISPKWFSELVLPLREANTASGKTAHKIAAALRASSSPLAAKRAAVTIKERHGEQSISSPVLMGQLLKPKPPIEKSVALPPLLNVDFNEWAPEYCGQPFNFLHCDFPYGIEYNAGRGQRTNAATIDIGGYDDAPDIYWTLLSTLLSNRDRLLATECHILFWYSQQFDDETRSTILRAWPDAVISKYRLIWHCADHSGLCPSPQREGRRNYETAFQITLGDRKIASPKDLSFSSPRNDTKIHRSQKHLPVLLHFLGMYCDTSTRMLDPSCGSATSVVAAKRLGAESVLGLEIDKEMFESAQRFYQENTNG
jgi:hypothetical protein